MFREHLNPTGGRLRARQCRRTPTISFAGRPTSRSLLGTVVTCFEPSGSGNFGRLSDRLNFGPDVSCFERSTCWCLPSGKYQFGHALRRLRCGWPSIVIPCQPPRSLASGFQCSRAHEYKLRLINYPGLNPLSNSAYRARNHHSDPEIDWHSIPHLAEARHLTAEYLRLLALNWQSRRGRLDGCW